jgi:hypothetical protein
LTGFLFPNNLSSIKRSLNLETAVGRKTAVQDIGVHGEIQKVVVTFVVMRHFCILLSAPRACVDFCDPTAVSRLKYPFGWLNF